MKILFIVAVAVAALAVSTAAQTATTRWSAMTLKEKRVSLHHTIKRDRTTVRWWINHRPRADTPFARFITAIVPRYERCKAIGIRSPEAVCIKATKMRHAMTILAAVEKQIIAAALPAHVALWRCIAGYPGARPGGGSGESGGNMWADNGSHFNILQMTNPWAGINPIGLPPAQIMRIAESQYAASGFSSSFLTQQWGQTIGPCWSFA